VTAYGAAIAVLTAEYKRTAGIERVGRRNLLPRYLEILRSRPRDPTSPRRT
jgi:hypothetical protein